MKEHENRLKALLMGQQFDEYEVKSSTLETAKKCAHAYAIATNGIAVLSDFQQNICYIHSGKLGITLGFLNILKTETQLLKTQYSMLFLPMSCLNAIYLN